MNLLKLRQQLQGLIEIKPKMKVFDKFALSLVYTPGVGKNCLDIQKNPDLLYEYTNTANSAVLLSDLSVIKNFSILWLQLEAISALGKKINNVDAYPLILDPKYTVTNEDYIETIDNLIPIYKVIVLTFMSPERVAFIRKHYQDSNAKFAIIAGSADKEFNLENQLRGSALVRAILDGRAFCANKSAELQELKTDIHIKNINNFDEQLDFLFAYHKFFLNNINQQIADAWNQKLKDFFNYGKKAYINEYDPNYQLIKNDYNTNSIQVHKRFRGMIEIKSKLQLHHNMNLICQQLNQNIAEFQTLSDDALVKLSVRRNWGAIITNGTAILGFGDIGSAAGLPVMEGKSVLFKLLGGINIMPLCFLEKEPKKFIRVARRVMINFQGINLEDIKAPECFEIEKALVSYQEFPLMHDDQHGTAVVTLAAIINGLKLIKKEPKDIKLIINGAGSAGIAICELLLHLGIKNIIMCDTTGSIFKGRTKNMNSYKEHVANITNPNLEDGTLDQVVKGSDILVGVSAAGSFKPHHIKSMNEKPFILALANPVPEILPSEAIEAGAFIIATGRSDFPNQVNNSLAFPGIFRGAMNVNAKVINNEMKLVAAYAISHLIPDSELSTTKILPTALDPTIPEIVCKLVAEAAKKSGVNQLDNSAEDAQESLTRYLVDGIYNPAL